MAVSAGMRGVLAGAAVLLSAANAHAAETSGGAALALAGLIARSAPSFSKTQKAAMENLADGRARAGAPIRVAADAVHCRAGNVDISFHSCELHFGKRVITLAGRRAHELYATLLEAGVPPDGAAGTIYAHAGKLRCEVSPTEVAAHAGGGAKCTWQDAR